MVRLLPRNALAALVRKASTLTAATSGTTRSAPLALYSYGEGFLGSLGNGDYELVENPQQLPTTTDLSIKQISAGWAHSGFVTTDGDAYVFGRPYSFRDVIRSTNLQRYAPWVSKMMTAFARAVQLDVLYPQRIELPEDERVAKIDCSAALTLVLTESGKLFTFGANGYGQCGIGQDGVSVATPTHIPLEDEVVDIAAGYQHALVTTKNGTLFSWGKGERGQLGYGSGNVYAPQEVVALKQKRIVQVSAGFNHSCALTADGELFIWGKLLNAMTNEDTKSNDQVTPRLLRTSDSVRLLKCSHFHTTFITNDNKAWVIGRTPAGHRVLEEGVQKVVPEMHRNAFLISNQTCGLAIEDVVQLGKGVMSTAFVTRDGRLFDWRFLRGMQQVSKAEGFRVKSFESGFHTHLMLASLMDKSTN